MERETSNYSKSKDTNGSNEESNLLTACRDCNLGKGESILGAI